MGKSNSNSRQCSLCGQQLGDELNCPQCGVDTIDETTDQSFEHDVTIAPEGMTSATTKGATDSPKGLNRFQDLDEIGTWEHGPIYRARHPGLDRYVLIRVLPLTDDQDQRAESEFIDRASALSRLDHPKTASIMEAGKDHDAAYIVQELVEGASLDSFGPGRSDAWKQGFFPNVELAKSMLDAAEGLHAIHELGVIHGNIDNQSIVRDAVGQVRLIGFVGVVNSALMDQHPSKRNDIRRLGSVFFNLTTGTQFHPEKGQSVEEIARDLKVSNPGLSHACCSVIGSCLTEGDDAYVDCSELIRDLKPLVSKQIVRATWRQRFFSAAIGVMAGVFVLSTAAAIAGAMFPGRVLLDAPQTLVLFVVLIPYTILMETLLGYTLIRRMFGYELLHVSGDPSHWGRRFGRSLIRFFALLLAPAILAMIIPLLSFLGDTAGQIVLLVILPIGLLSPIWALYLPSLFISDRWTYYDRWTGVTWAEIMTKSRVQETERAVKEPIFAASGSPIDVVDQFEIHQTLGTGGMGAVYLARDLTLDRPVALKVLASHLIEDDSLQERFQREARLAAKVSHPNIATVYGNGNWNNSPYIAMELVAGRDLDEVIKQDGKMTVDEAWQLILQAAEGLSAAKKLGVIHRDIKPANLMLTHDGRIKVMDFGISREIGVEAGVTQTGAILGTPTYMAPEQAKGQPVDCRCDIYSLGLTLYYLVAGQSPFSGRNAMEVLAQKIESGPPPLMGQIAGLTKARNSVLSKMIAKDPVDRYQDYDQLLFDLNQLANEELPLAKPARRIVAEICNVGGFYLLLGILSLLVLAMDPVVRMPFDINTSIVYLTIAMTLPYVLMYVVGIARSGKTTGKKFLSLKVVRSNGQPVGLFRSLIRFVVMYPVICFLLIEALLATVGLGTEAGAQSAMYSWLFYANLALLSVSAAIMFWHPMRKSLQDLITDTIVVRTRQ